MKSDLTKSITKKAIWESRINACLLRNKDTRFKVKTSNRLQAKLIVDKITDCCSIIKSAVDNGVVPNLISYGHLRMTRLAAIHKANDESSLYAEICDRIRRAIEGLFDDIWHSKYGDSENGETDIMCTNLKDNFYNYMGIGGTLFSFDIISEQTCAYTNFPTSSQYDLEVLVAGISIVKYMLTSKLFIFDSCLLQPHGDKGYVDPSMF